ncbi:MAG: ankyrin repeat domain-containing protein [Treponemataceae bacterium]
MRWILLVPNKSIAGIEQITAFIAKNTTKIEILTFFDGDQHDIEKTKTILQGSSHAIIFYTKEINTPFFNYCVGYIEGKNMPALLYSLEENIPPILDFSLHFSSTSTVLDALEKNLNFYLSEDGKNLARKKLLDSGITFSSDIFTVNIIKGDESMCALFLNAGIAIDERDDDGTPLISIAVRNGKENIVRLFIDRGADVNAVSKDRGYSPLMDAVWKNNINISALLIENGANLNHIADDGQSVFVLAVGCGNEDICELLASHGADPFAKDHMGMSAYDYAKLFKKDKIISIIDEFCK